MPRGGANVRIQAHPRRERRPFPDPSPGCGTTTLETRAEFVQAQGGFVAPLSEYAGIKRFQSACVAEIICLCSLPA